MKHFTTLNTVITALVAAMICVATMIVQIPIPATGGYANPGDGIILTGAFLLNPAQSVIAAGLGSLLADLLSGYAAYAPGTLVIKAGVALIAALTYRRFGQNRSRKAALAIMTAAGILAETFMTLGYFLYEAVILGLGAGAAGGLIGNAAQGVVGVIIACIAAPVIGKAQKSLQ